MAPATAPSTGIALPLLTADEAAGVAPQAWTRSSLSEPHRFDAADVLSHWAVLHPADHEPVNAALLEGWVHFHNGDFARAALCGHACGDTGLRLVYQSTAIYACYVEAREANRLALLRQIAQRTQDRLRQDPHDVSALFWQAFALGRHAQSVSVARALAQGLGGQIKHALEQVLVLNPNHADAHFALGAFHAEVIDKVGTLVARMTYGLQAESAQALFERGLQLSPQSAIGHLEYARALLALYGEAEHERASALQARAAAIPPLDMHGRLVQELARQSLLD